MSPLDGYVARFDVFERHFEGCSLLQQAKTLVKPLQHVKRTLKMSRSTIYRCTLWVLSFFASTMKRP